MKFSLQDRSTYGISPTRYQILVFVDGVRSPVHEQHGFYTMSNAARSFLAILPHIQQQFPNCKEISINILEEEKA